MSVRARSAMPMVEALRRCPQAVVVRPRHERYSEMSAQVFAVFRRRHTFVGHDLPAAEGKLPDSA